MSRAARGLSHFVGRAADLRTLDGALEQTAAGNGQVVGVVAEAGTGKSRLCFEFLERCRARGMYARKEAKALDGRHFRRLDSRPKGSSVSVPGMEKCNTTTSS